eukprot:347417-Chlamydomonas_euryale.AAC.8
MTRFVLSFLPALAEAAATADALWRHAHRHVPALRLTPRRGSVAAPLLSLRARSRRSANQLGGLRAVAQPRGGGGLRQAAAAAGSRVLEPDE